MSIRRCSLAAIMLLASLGTACLSSGPQKTLNVLAEAMERNDSATFLSQLDLKVIAANAVKTITREDRALSTLDALGRRLGLGGMEELLGNVMDMERSLRADFSRGVSTGELMARCRKAETPDCPWTPEALKNARIKEVGQDCAIAQVTTSARMTSWLALRKQREEWRVVGQAVMEDEAREYATSTPSSPQPQKESQRPDEDVTRL